VLERPGMHFARLYLNENFNILKALVAAIDARLDKLDLDCEACPDAYGWGLLDIGEALCGMGFVACQQYITAVASDWRLSKQDALSCGPRHSCGARLVAIVNDAANAWKHSDEWSLSDSPSKQAKRALEGLGRIVSEDTNCEYVLAEILSRLSEPEQKGRFRNLLPLLSEWADDLRRKYPTPAHYGATL